MTIGVGALAAGALGQGIEATRLATVVGTNSANFLVFRPKGNFRRNPGVGFCLVTLRFLKLGIDPMTRTQYY